MSAEATLNRLSRLGAGLTLIFSIAFGLLSFASPLVSVAAALASGGLLLWWIGKWGANASLSCAVALVALAVISMPGFGTWQPPWIRFPSWLGPLALLITGISLMSLRLRRRSWFNASMWLGAGIITLAVLVLLSAAMGYAAGKSTAGALLALFAGVSITVTRMGPRFLQLIERKSPAGDIGRWMLVVVIVVPATLHVFQLKAMPPSAQGGVLSLALSSFIYAMVLLGVLMFSLRRLDMLELARAEAQAERDRLMVRLQQEAATLQQQVANRTQELATALKASMRFDHLARATASGVMITDASGRIEWVNPAWERFSGYTLADVQGLRPREFLHGPETQTTEKEIISNAVKAGQPAKGELINYRKNGQPFWIELEMQPMRSEVGEVTNFFAIVSDITGRKELAEEQRRLHDRLSLALKALDCGVWDFDTINNKQTWDSRQCEIYGFTPCDTPGNIEGFHKVVHPDDIERVHNACNQACESDDDAFEYTFRIIRPDGALRHIAAHGIVRRDESGKVVRMVGLDRDVTAAEELREQLRVAEERWHLALSGTNDGVWDANLETGKSFYDRRWAEIVGETQETVLAEKDAWTDRIHADDLQRALNALNAHLANETPFYSCEFRMRHASGNWVWVLSRGRVVSRNAQGRPTRITGTHSDITVRKALEDQLRKSEALLLQLEQLASIGAWEVDLDTRVVTWSPEIYRIHEVEPGYMPVYHSVLEFHPEAARRVLVDAINAASETGTPFDLELPFTSARGRKLWVRVKGRAEKGKGARNRVYGAFQDITVRREAEELRHQLESQLFQTQKMETLGTLAGGIAHDFNNLLTGILGYQDLALDTLEENHPSRADIASAREASMRARELVDQVLIFSRQADSEKVPVDLAHIIEDALRFLKVTLPSSINIEVDVADGCEPVLADAAQIYKVILNLASNAAHALPQTGGVMRLTARPTSGAGEPGRGAAPMGSRRFVRLEFSDTGHGMSEETRKRIFDPFFTTKEVGQGTGLGLSVVHGIIQAHQGMINVESESGKGTTFTIHLPVAEGTAGENVDGSEEAPRGNGEHIAIVDDDDIARRVSQIALERSGYRVESFDRPGDCLEAIRARPAGFAMLLTDQTMPDMCGIELATEVRRQLPELPVIIMSGYFSRFAPETLAKLGQVELLSKPFTNAELTRAVHRTLQRASSAAT